jgi:hypothetical protein
MKEREEKKKVLDPSTERMFFFFRRHCKVFIVESGRKEVRLF